MNIDRCDQTDLKKIFSNERDIRRDIHIYVSYINERDVKRRHRTNDLGKADAKRLSKKIGSLTYEEIKTNNESSWLNFIDWIVLQLGFVSYDAKGTYMGYTSTEPSYPDNYITVNKKVYDDFLQLSLYGQEQQLLKTLLNFYKYSDNEFFDNSVSPLSTLDKFTIRGCATNVIPIIKFNEARLFLLRILKNCEADTWYYISSFIQYVKQHHPFFLIPEKPNVTDPWWDKNRYSNFYDGPKKNNFYNQDDSIPGDASDGFERVEGRYIERFLEGIPLTMRYVDVSYDADTTQDIYPSINKIKGFKVNKRFLKVMHKKIAQPTAIIQPNFTIHINADLYPITTIKKFQPYADIVSEDVSFILKLKKNKIAKKLAENPDLDIINVLKNNIKNEIPQNILAELKEWKTHSDAFILYDGVGLLECDKNFDFLEKYIVKDISKNIKMISSPKRVFSTLEKKELIPVKINHTQNTLKKPPYGVKSILVKKQKKSNKQKKSISLKQRTLYTLFFPTKEFTTMISKELKKMNCPFELDKSTKSITIAENQKTTVNKIFHNLKDDYIINIKEIT